MAEDETLSCLRLSLVPDVGAVTARRLVEHFGSAGEALKASERELSCVERVGPKIASAILDSNQLLRLLDGKQESQNLKSDCS